MKNTKNIIIIILVLLLVISFWLITLKLNLQQGLSSNVRSGLTFEELRNEIGNILSKSPLTKQSTDNDQQSTVNELAEKLADELKSQETQETQEAQEIQDWKTYTNSVYNYTLLYPEIWSYRERGDDNAVGFDNKDAINELDPDVTTYTVSISVIENPKLIPINEWLENYYQGMNFPDKINMQVDSYNAIRTSMAPTMRNEIIETHVQKNHQIFIIRLSGSPEINNIDEYYYSYMLLALKFLE